MRCRAVDAGNDLEQTVALIVLAAVGIARPVDHYERLVARLEHRQDHFGRDVGEIVLLRDVRDGRTRRLEITELRIVAARRRRGRKAGRRQCGLDLLGERDAVRRTGPVVEDDGVGAGACGVVENEGRAELAHRDRAVALRARELQDRLFVEIAVVEMVVQLVEHAVVLDERRHAVVEALQREAAVKRVAEVAGVAEIMAGRHRGCVRGGECRHQRVRILEIGALVADRGHGRRQFGRDLAGTHPVGNEQDHVMRARLVLRRTGLKREQAQRERDEQSQHRRIPPGGTRSVPIPCDRHKSAGHLIDFFAATPQRLKAGLEVSRVCSSAS